MVDSNGGEIKTPDVRVGTKDLEVKDQLAIVLKEYDALRKQVDQGSAFQQGLVIPMSLALAGAMVGWQGKIPPELAVMAVPVLIMAVLAAALHGEVYVEYSGQLLAEVEDRVFKISGLALLTHETRFTRKRILAGGRRWALAVAAVSTAYIIVELLLCHIVGKEAFECVSPNMIVVACSAALAPVLYGIAMTIRITMARSSWPETALSAHLADQEAARVKAS